MPEPKQLRPYQQQSLAILARDDHGLDASEMGAGKTLVAVERLRQIPTPGIPRVLVIAPVNTHRDWISTFAAQYPALEGSPYLRIVKGGPKADPKSWALMTSRQPGVYVIGWESMRGALPSALALKVLNLQADVHYCIEKYGKDSPEADAAARRLGLFLEENRALLESAAKKEKPTQDKIRQAIKVGLIPPWTRTGTWDLVVADEVHRIANHQALGAKVIKMIKTHHRHGASGTPGGNKIEGIWGVAHWLWPDLFRSFWAWAEQYLLVEDQVINRDGKTVQVVRGEKEPGIAFDSLPCKVRHRTEDVIDQMPAVVEREVLVSMGAEQARIYNDLETAAFTWLETASLATQLPIEQRLRLRQAALGEIDITILSDEEWEVDFAKKAPNPKIDALKEIISDLPEGERVLVFTHSGKFARLVVERLGRKARLWSGDVTQNRRTALKAAFAAGEFQILVAQTEAMAEGVDGLQFTCRCEIWLSESDNMIMNQQAQRRLHRPGQKSQTVQRWYIRSADTVDETVKAKLLFRGEQLAIAYHDVTAEAG